MLIENAERSVRNTPTWTAACSCWQWAWETGRPMTSWTREGWQCNWRRARSGVCSTLPAMRWSSAQLAGRGRCFIDVWWYGEMCERCIWLDRAMSGLPCEVFTGLHIFFVILCVCFSLLWFGCICVWRLLLRSVIVCIKLVKIHSCIFHDIYHDTRPAHVLWEYHIVNVSEGTILI